MNTFDWKKLLPAGAAIVLFYLLSLAYFSPVLEGKRLVQGDKRNWQGMAQEVIEHRDAYGDEPLWTGSMFSGMPAYQVSVQWSANLLHHVDRLFHGFLPRPAGFLFLYLVGMFILLRCLRVDPWLGVVGSVAFAFSSYFFIILEAGHNSKANAIGYMPMVLGGFYLLYRGEKLLGAALFALFLGLEISMNHVQITYYLGIVLVLFALAEGVRAMREKALAGFVQRSLLGLAAVVLAASCNLGLLWSTWEYGQYTTRGKSELTIRPDGSPADDIRTEGLDRDYVTDWSYGKQESFSLLVPNAKGGASGSIVQSQADLARITDPAFRNAVVKEYQGGSYINNYWGDQRFTSGPVYLGAVVVLLLFLALAQAEGRARWWVLAAIPLVAVLLVVQSPVLAGLLVIAYLVAGLFLWNEPLRYALFAGLLLTLLLSWGRNYMPLTDFFLDHVPGYDKFRAVTIILVVVELAAPVLGVLYLERLLSNGAWDKLKERRFLIASGVLVLLLLVMLAAPGSLFDFLSDAERARFNASYDAGGAGQAEVVTLVDGIKSLRMEVFRADVLRSLVFVLLAGGLVFLAGRRKVGRPVFLAVLGLLVLVDLWAVDKRYVNNEKEQGRYVQWEDEQRSKLPFSATAADQAILQQEFAPAMEQDLQATLARLKEAKSDAKGRDKLVTPEEEELARFGVLRRNSHYRVLTLNNPFNDSRVSYFHKSVGGYHGAKLKRYQELIEFHISPELQAVIGALQSGTDLQGINDVLAQQGVLNMLNTRYLIYSPDQAPIRNLHALGAAWFVEGVRWVPDSDAEILALGEVDPARTVVVDERFRGRLDDAKATADASADITLTGYRADRVTYRATSANGGVAVFSEIWYGPDWQAYVDGQPADHVRGDYVLRVMDLPAGEHTVEFRLESRPYRTGSAVMTAGSALVILLALAALGRAWRRSPGGEA
ncbi:MAG: hypothetical protein H6593_01030 [Flavobacteriales bacterium]|nr:hypothetical protein [Flavobacteriales bacterium]